MKRFSDHSVVLPALIWSVCVGGLCLAGDDAPRAASAAKIEALIRQLSGASYEDRESADAALREIGPPAIEALARAYRERDDYETDVRIQRISEHIYFWGRILHKHGFLGIQHALYQKGHVLYRPRDPRVPAGNAAFVVNQVILETAAHRAGLRRGDIIVAVNDTSVKKDADGMAFANLIRKKPPGSEIKFSFWRGDKLIEQRIIIGHRPPNLYALPEVKREYAEHLEAFPKWWTTHFGPWSSRRSSGDVPFPNLPPPDVQEK